MRKLLPFLVAFAAFFTFAPVASLLMAVWNSIKHWGGFTCLAYFWAKERLKK